MSIGANLRSQLIVVPSCQEHNSGKSKDDEFLMWVLAICDRGNHVQKGHFEGKVLRAFNRAPNLFLDSMKNLRKITVSPFGDNSFETGSFEVDRDRFDSCMIRIAAGIYYHRSGRRWRGDFRVFTNAFIWADVEGGGRAEIDGHSDKISESFRSLPILGENPDVFCYQYYSGVESAVDTLKMIFYGSIYVFVALTGGRS